MFSKLAPGFLVSDSSFRAICFIGSPKSDQLQGGDTSFQRRDITHVPVRSSPSLCQDGRAPAVPLSVFWQFNLQPVLNLWAPQGGPSRMEPGCSAPPQPCASHPYVGQIKASLFHWKCPCFSEVYAWLPSLVGLAGDN